MNKSESKYFNTALRMDEALVSLLKEKSLEYITVKEICARAGVNRSTFYLHYETIDDLLSECVENTNKKFISYFEEKGNGFIENIQHAPLEDLILITPEYLHPYLRFVRENKEVFTAAICNPSGMRSVAKFEGLYKYILDPILERFDYPQKAREYAIAFYVNGIMAVIKKWLDRGCEDTIEQISDVITGCIRPRTSETWKKGSKD